MGDKVVIYDNIHTIIKENKTQFICQWYGSKDKEGFVRITKNGKVIGGYGYARVLNVTPKQFYAAKNAKIAAKQAENDQRKTAWDAKVAAVRAANQNITVVDEGHGLSKAVLVNEAGKDVIVFFEAKEGGLWIDYSKPSVKGVQITCSTWAKHRSEQYQFSQTNARGLNIEDALIYLVANYYWY